MRLTRLPAQRADPPHLLRLAGPQMALEVSAPLPGVLRLRHAAVAHHSSSTPQLAPKHSWAVPAASLDQPQPLTVAEGGSGWLEIAGAGLTLRLDQATGTWVAGSNGRKLLASTLVEGRVRQDDAAGSYRSRLCLEAEAGLAYLGFGEKYGPLDKRGLHFTFWNTDVVPHMPDTDPFYQSIPFFIGLDPSENGHAWGFFLDESWRSEVDVAAADPNSIEWQVWGPELDCYLIAGPSIAEVVAHYTALTGRTPLPPLWSLGMQQSRWGYSHQQEILGIIEGYRSRNLPLDVAYLDIDYMDGYKIWTFDQARYPDPKLLSQQAAAQGVKLVTIIDPGIKQQAGYPVYDQALANDYLVRVDRGEVLVGEVWPRPAVYPDFSQEKARNWWAGWHKSFLDLGIAGFWNDMNEPSAFSLQSEHGFTSEGDVIAGVRQTEGKTLPYNARHGIRRHLEVHNVYALEMCRASREGMLAARPDERPFVLTRAGFAGIQRYSAVWTGDNSSYWSHLEDSITMLLGLGLSGVAFTGADIPGFAASATPELFVRWMQLGVFYPLMRNHSATGTPYQEPWRFGAAALALARQSLEQRYRLLPTLYSLMNEAHEQGLPVLRPLLMLEQGHDSLHCNDAFLFGPDLLVAPAVRPGCHKRLVYLPNHAAERWVELRFQGSELYATALLEAGYHIADCPAERTPLFLRAGGGIALTKAALHTSSANWSSLEWHLAAAEQLSTTLYEDQGQGYAHEQGVLRRTEIVGASSGGSFTLKRNSEGQLPAARDEETLFIYGMSKITAVRGVRQWQYWDGVLRLLAPAVWREIVIDGLIVGGEESAEGIGA
jgi:alpha-glucosidase